MEAPLNGDGDDNMPTDNTNPDGIGASDPVVYQLVRVSGDGMLIPATDDELIEFEHFEDESKLFHTNCGTRKSNCAEIDLKEFVSKEQMDAVGRSFIQSNKSDNYAKGQPIEAHTETGNKDPTGGEDSVSETYSSLRPDFSMLKGDICLDNFSIRELQEAFRATFGRFTSIRDKLWLKRRIAMGLTNSYDVPSFNFFIKDNKIVLNNVKERASRTACNLSDSGLITINTALSNETLEVARFDAVEELQPLTSKGSEKSLDICHEDIVNAQVEECGIKRIRKPTKRYIEELSEVESTECSGRSATLDKTSSQDRHLLKSRIRKTCMVDTSQEFLGGYNTRIPCVYRGRRRQPRKNFLALMNFVHMEGEKQCPEELNGQRLSSQGQHEKFISSQGDAIDENLGTVQAVVANVRRKHHRAWTLGEVLKLVEGVSRYGAGKWSEIRRAAFTSGFHRTSVDLKDKWRNLLKASYAQVPSDRGIVNYRKPTSLPIPASILLRVRELAEKHSQSGTEFGSSQFIVHGGIVQEKGTAFL